LVGFRRRPVPGFAQLVTDHLHRSLPDASCLDDQTKRKYEARLDDAPELHLSATRV